MTIEEIAQELMNRFFRNFKYYRNYQRSEYYLSRRILFNTNFRELQDFLTNVLEDLAELGLVTPASPEESSGFSRWRLGDSWHPPEPPSDGGDGPPTDSSDDNEGGDGGVREVLGHPVLLALTREDFDELVDGLFEEEH